MAVLYILNSPGFWNHEDTVFKVGYTTNLAQRLSAYTTYSAAPILVVRSWRVTHIPARFATGFELDRLLPDLIQRAPDDIRHLNEGGGTEFYAFPHRAFDVVRQLYEEQGFELEETRSEAEVVTRKPIDDGAQTRRALLTPALRPHQRIALDAAVKAHDASPPGSPARRVLQYSVGSGKTAIGVALHLRCRGHTLWITFRNDIVDSQLKEFGVIGAADVLICTRGRWNPERVIRFCAGGRDRLVVVLRQALDDGDVEAVKDVFDTLIVDEAHACCGERVVGHIRALQMGARMRLALAMTATPFTDVPSERSAMLALWGDGRAMALLCPSYSLFQAHADGRLAKAHAVLHLVPPALVAAMADGHTANVDALARAMAADIARYSPAFNAIVRVASIAKVDVVFDALRRLPDLGRDVMRSHSALGSDDNGQKAFTQAPPGAAVIVVCDQMETGYDNPRVGITLLAKGGDDYPSHRLIQAWGRGLRNYPGKTDGVLVVYLSPDAEGTNVRYIAHRFVQQCDSLELVSPEDRARGVAVVNALRREVMRLEIVDDARPSGATYEYTAEEIEADVERCTIERAIAREGGNVTYRMAKRLCTKAIPPIRSAEEYATRRTGLSPLLPSTPSVTFHEEWTTWVDFLDADTADSLPTKEAWQKRCIEESIKNTAEYAAARARGVHLPPDPGAIYRNFTNLTTELRALRF